MKVGIVHLISDPSEFLRAGQKMSQAGLPEGISLVSSYATTTQDRAFCVWEADSVESLQAFLEPNLSPHSKNEYFEVLDTRSMV